MKRTQIDLTTIADIRNLVWAAWRASREKRNSRAVRSFRQNLIVECQQLRSQLLRGSYIPDRPRTFHIRDPKPRIISAPSFRDRVVQHALVRYVGPVLDRSLIDDTFACRTGKGTAATLRRTQQHIQRFSWFVKMDVRKYFASIRHDVLLDLLERRIKGQSTLQLIRQIIVGNEGTSRRGLPIGALTSQVFANYYLHRLDRMMVEHSVCRGYVRYMDDFVTWCDDNASGRILRDTAQAILADNLGLELNDPAVINRSSRGLTLCGFRLFPGTIRLTLSRRRRFLQKLKKRQRQHDSGLITENQFQQYCEALMGSGKPADIRGWFRTLRDGEVARAND